MGLPEKNPVRISLKVKAVSFITLTILVLGIILSWYFLNQAEEILTGELQKRALSFTKNLAHSSKYGILTEDNEILSEVVEGILQEDSVLFVRISNAQGKILIDKFKHGKSKVSLPLILQHIDSLDIVKNPKASIDFHIIDDVGFYHTFTPVEASGSPSKREKRLSKALLLIGEESNSGSSDAQDAVQYGNVQVILSTEKMLAEVHRIFAKGAGLTLLIVLLAVIISFAVVDYIVKPIQAMVEASIRIIKGDLSQRVKVKSHDEIGMLAATFNKMSESLFRMTQKQQQQLAELSALHDIGLSMSSTLDMDQLIELTIDAAVKQLGYDRALFFHHDIERQALVNGRMAGVSKEIQSQVMDLSIPLQDGKGHFATVVLKGEPVLVEGAKEVKERAYGTMSDIIGSHSFLAVPVKFENKILGVIAVEKLNTNQSLTSDDTRLLTTLSNELAIAIANSTAYREVEQLNISLERKVQERTAELQLQQERLQETNKELKKATRHKSDFLARMSHELRTPLNAIIGYSEMLEEEAEEMGQKEFVTDLQKIHSAGKHLHSLINDILDLSKIEAGKMDLYLEPIEIKTLVSDIVTTIKPLMEKNANTLQVSCPDDIGMIRADMTKLRQMLFNLLSNAGKFTERGTVSLDIARTTLEDGEWLTFRVSDTGIGMSSEQMKNLFQEFSQADASTTRKYGGTGLGLVISQRFCQMMGGDIAVDSEVGKGSTFTIWLPAKVAEDGADSDITSEESEALSHPLGDACKVLIIDDEQSVRELMQRFLNKEGFQVICASGGKQGLKLAKEIHPAAITLDVLMPDIDGWSVLTELKADKDLAGIPVIIVTILDEKDLGYSLGASDYLIKPINRNRLITIINKHCHQYESTFQVLVVEDDCDVRNMIKRMLEKEGWKVAEADNGRAALDSIAKSVPQLILLNLMMPVMDGLEFLEELRKHREWRSIPVVVLTAKDLTEDDRRQLSGHVQKVLEKAVLSRDELLQELRELMAACMQQETTKDDTKEDGTAKPSN